MKLRSKLGHNIGLNAQHKPGGGVPPRIQIPAGSLMEFDDEMWLEYKDAAAPAIKAGGLVIVEDVPLTEEETQAQLEADLEAAQKLIDSNKPDADKPDVDKPDVDKPDQGSVLNKIKDSA